MENEFLNMIYEKKKKCKALEIFLEDNNSLV